MSREQDVASGKRLKQQPRSATGSPATSQDHQHALLKPGFGPEAADATGGLAKNPKLLATTADAALRQMGPEHGMQGHQESPLSQARHQQQQTPSPHISANKLPRKHSAGPAGSDRPPQQQQHSSFDKKGERCQQGISSGCGVSSGLDSLPSIADLPKISSQEYLQQVGHSNMCKYVQIWAAECLSDMLTVILGQNKATGAEDR